MDFKIPPSLKVEHEELHGELVKAMKMPGRVGGLLASLAEGKVTPEMRQVLALTDKLKAELRQMLAEHQAIVGALKKLVVAAEADGKPEVARFAGKLMLHAQTEQEVLYPTAILIGEYLKMRLAR